MRYRHLRFVLAHFRREQEMGCAAEKDENRFKYKGESLERDWAGFLRIRKAEKKRVESQLSITTLETHFLDKN